jgi:hypothetical protein
MRRILRPATVVAAFALVALSACASPTAPSATKKVAAPSASAADDTPPPPSDGYVVGQGK